MTEKAPVAQWLSSKEMDTANWVQLLEDAVYISHKAKILGKSMNPIILSLSLAKD